jgi:hypothetical protein
VRTSLNTGGDALYNTKTRKECRQKFLKTIQITASNIFTNYREQLEIVQYISECREEIPQQ